MTTLATTAMREPGMKLDKRQRAMLKEMGVQVWQPSPVTPAPAVTSVKPATPAAKSVATPASTASSPSSAIYSGATSAYIQSSSSTFDTSKPTLEAPQTAPAAVTAHADAWRVGQLQTLYTPADPASAARWLVLIESPVSALNEAFNPFDGEAGKLLDNMLRAAKLHTAGRAMLAPLVRGSSAAGDLPAELAGIFASAQADVVLVMGRLAAQALLQSTEPLAKLRGHTHQLLGSPTVVTIDPAYLLRNPLDKAKAWDDLCLAISVAGPVSTP